jgi:uncharacterized membrane protein
MIRQLWESLKEQSVFQGLLTVLLILLAPALSRALFADTVDLMVFRLTLGAVFFHFLYLTLMTFLFYLELYRQAFFSSLAFFVVNAAAAAATLLAGDMSLSGLSYLLGGVAGSAVAAESLFSRIRSIDRTIYARYSLG